MFYVWLHRGAPHTGKCRKPPCPRTPLTALRCPVFRASTRNRATVFRDIASPAASSRPAAPSRPVAPVTRASAHFRVGCLILPKSQPHVHERTGKFKMTSRGCLSCRQTMIVLTPECAGSPPSRPRCPQRRGRQLLPIRWDFLPVMVLFMHGRFPPFPCLIGDRRSSG